MVKLRDLKFKFKYDALQDNIAKDFYVKALSHASFYDRISAYFDSKILAYYSQGIENIFNKQGKIRFIFSESLEEGDYNLIKQGYSERANNQLKHDFGDDEILDEIDKMRLSNLAYLISIGLVDIKIAFTKEGINHAKIGLIYDDENNYVYFRGSSNETVAGIRKNIENFEVSCSWDKQDIENKKIEDAKSQFNDLWENKYPGAVVVDVPDIIYKKIASYNKGKLILSYDFIPENAIVADISDDKVFMVYNNLEDDFDIESNRYYRIQIAEDVIKKEGKKYIFGNINYKEILRLIKYFEKIADSEGKTFYMTSKLVDYIDKVKYEIGKIQSLGCAIKQQDESIRQEFEKFSDIVNKELKRKLRPKQMWDAFFMGRMIKSANYSVPGAGKTSIVYGAYSYLTSHEIDEIDNLVVVGPISSFKSRKDEFIECFKEKRKLNPLIVRDLGTKGEKERKLKLNGKQYNLILINYEGVSPIQKTLAEVIDDRTMLVFDEVHKIKAYKGKWATASLNICKNAKYKVILSGTPIPNSYGDLYNQLNILYTNEYKDFFEYDYGQLSSNSLDIQENINEKIYPFFCRTTKKDLGVPPPEKDKIIEKFMTGKEQQLFTLIHKRFSRNVLLMYIRLLQASTNPKLILDSIDKQTLEDFYEYNDKYESDTSYDYKKKLEELDDEIEFSSDEKDLICSIDMTSKFRAGIDEVKELTDQINPKTNKPKSVIVRGIFVKTLERISKELTKRDIKNKIIYGSVSPDEREQIIEDFKQGKFQVLITNPHTMAESVSLHMVCHDAVYFEYSFNLTHMIQSRDRINRLGLDDDQYTRYYYLRLRNEDGIDDSIDTKTYDRLKKKEEVMLEAIEGDNIVLINYDDLDEIKKILNIE